MAVQNWLADSYTADRKRSRVSSTYSRDFWVLYRPGITLADLIHEHPELFGEALDQKILLNRTDHSLGAHARTRVSHAASTMAVLTGRYELNDFAMDIYPRGLEVDYTLDTVDAAAVVLRDDDAITIWTSSLPIYIKLYRE